MQLPSFSGRRLGCTSNRARALCASVVVVFLVWCTGCSGTAGTPDGGSKSSVGGAVDAELVFYGSNATFIVADAFSHNVFTAVFEDDNVSVWRGPLDASSQAIPPLETDGFLVDIGLQPDTRQLYVYEHYGIRVFDVDSLTSTRYVPFDHDQFAVVMGGSLQVYSGGAYVITGLNDINSGNRVSRIDEQPVPTPVATFDSDANAMGVNFRSGDLYVRADSDIHLLDPEGSIKMTVSDPGIVAGAVDPNTNTLFAVKHESGNDKLVSIHENGDTDTIDPGQSRLGPPYVDAEARRIYIGNPEAGQIVVIDADSLEVRGAITLMKDGRAGSPGDLAVDQAGGLLYTSDGLAVPLSELADM